MTTFSSFVADEAAAAVRAAASEIGPTAGPLAADAAALVYRPSALAAAIRAAIVAITDIDRLIGLATSGLATLPGVSIATANRRRQGANQAALTELVRGIASVALARRVAAEGYRDRTALITARDAVIDAIDARAELATTDTFRALQSLRGALASRVDAQLRNLPQIVRATPGVVRPSLTLAYAIYDDIGRAGEIVGRNELPRPGFVPARPIEVLSE